MATDLRDGTARCGRFTVDLLTRELYDGDRRLPIQDKQLELLVALMEDPGRLVTREKLGERLWADVPGDFGPRLDTTVRKLRKVLRDPARTPLYIETLPRRGYRLLAPVSVGPLHPVEFLGRHTNFPASQPAPPKTEADRLYLEGYHCWNKRTPAAQEQALDCFLKARNLEPANSSYSTAIAQTYFMLAWHGVVRPVDAIAEAKSAAVTAILHDHTQLLARFVLAAVRGAFDYDLRGAIDDLRSLLLLAPDQPWGHLELCVFALATGAQEEAYPALRRAEEINPVSPATSAMRGFARYLGGRFEKAEALGRRAVERDPEFGLARFYYGSELMALGRFEDAVREFTLADQLMPGQLEVRALLGVAAAMSGDAARAMELDAELEETARSRYADAYHRALLKDALGEREAALSLLEQACEDHSHWFCLAAVDPKLEKLRAERRIHALLDRIRR